MIIDDTQGTPELDAYFETLNIATQGEPTMNTQTASPMPIELIEPRLAADGKLDCHCGSPSEPGVVHRTDAPCYLIEPETATPEKELADTLSATLVNTLIALLTPRIEAMVEKKFAELTTNADTLAQMSDNFRTEITSLVDDAISEAISTHENDHEHPSEDTIDDRVDYALRHADNVVTEDSLSQKVSDILDEELEGRVSNILDNATIETTISF